jgi:NAD(P)H-hydrate epimerase
MKIVTASQMRAVDSAAIAEFGIPGAVLMENAGRGVAELVRELAPAGAEVCLVCGKGNNGGDGFVAARYLHQWGLRPSVYLCAEEGALGGDALVHHRVLRHLEVPVEVVLEARALQRAARRWEKAAALVDALLGTGVTGEVTGFYRSVIEAMNVHQPGLVVAVDIPSGLNADTGVVAGVAVRAHATVTFGLPKVGLYLGSGPDYCGELTCSDIGIPNECVAGCEVAGELMQRAQVRDWLPRLAPTAHKGTRGRVLVVAGSRGFTGAAALCSESTLPAGAGMCFLAVPESLNATLEAKVTEVITVPVPEGESGSLGAGALAQLKEKAKECEAVVIGPGLSRAREVGDVVVGLMKAAERPMVLDADGLNALEGRAEELRKRRGPTVVTPHPGEMARLTGQSVAAVKFEAVECARRFASEHDVVVVLKQARTVVAGPRGELYVCPLGNPGMATAGCGDVLTGVIGGLLAQGMAPLRAAVCAVYLHALAGDLCAQAEGQRGVLAGKILRQLPAAFRAVEDGC